MQKRLLTRKELNIIRFTIEDMFGLSVYYESPDGEPQKGYILVCANAETAASVRAWATGHIEVSEGHGVPTETVWLIVKLIEILTHQLTASTVPHV